MKLGIKCLGFALFLGYCGVAQTAALDPQAVEGFIEEMVDEHGFDRTELSNLMSQARRSERIIKAMSRPAEKAKPWFEYQKHFITAARVNGGVEFWKANADSLSAAAAKFGVPEEIVVAIIGVETAYGKITGRDRVVDALATLAFHYPNAKAKRMRFFRSQLQHLLLMSREFDLDPLTLTGSYAGAMGIPQFMPESYRKFAVDFNDDGKKNIWDDRTDAIGSVANYLMSHGWARNQTIVVEAKSDNANTEDLIADDVKPHRTISEFNELGILTGPENRDELAALFTLEGKNHTEYWLALNNFYVIMRYNPRTKYAMAVVKLAQAIREARAETMS